MVKHKYEDFCKGLFKNKSNEIYEFSNESNKKEKFISKNKIIYPHLGIITNTKMKNKLSILIYYFILINLIVPIFTHNNKISKKINFAYEIKIKLMGTGTQKIFGDYFGDNNLPSRVLLNGNSASTSGKSILNLVNEENIITLSWNSYLNDCSYMFYQITNLIEVDLSNFDASETTTMAYMFADCTNLLSINFDNIKTQNCGDMTGLFMKCESLTYIDVSIFDTSSLSVMGEMFSGCTSLISIEFGNFNTSKVTNFASLFKKCNSLISLDLSKFDVSSANYFSFMFNGCSSLISLNLSNFRTKSATQLSCLFQDCTNLQYVDISNFDTTNVNWLSYIFSNCVNLKYINLKNFIEGSSLQFSSFLDGVPDDLTYCVNNVDNIPLILEQLKTKTCIINDCSDDWNTKTKIIINEKNICVYHCSEDDTYKFEYKNKCYNICPSGTIESIENNKCLIVCSEETPFEKEEECYSVCTAQEFFNEICIINNKAISAIEKMANIIDNEIMDESMESLLEDVLNENIDLIIEKGDMNEIYRITSTSNQRINKDNSNEIIIDFENCENILKENNIINNDDSLIIFEMNYFLDDFSIPIIEYDLFNSLTKERIDLDICSETTINIYMPVEIDEDNLYLYNPYSQYYKNKNYPNPLDNDNENILIERKDYFNENYLSLCENNCIFKEYNIDTQKVLCECKVKTNFERYSEIINNKDNLLFHITEIESEEDLNLDSTAEINKEVNTEVIINSHNTELINSNYIQTSNNFNNKCLFKEAITKECEEIVSFQDLLKNIYMPLDNKDSIEKVFELFSEEIKNLNITNDEIIEGENVIFQMTTTTNQINNLKYNLYSNISSIILGECENILQEHYHIDSPLIILKVDIKRNDTISTQVEYEVYNPNDLTKLNLSYCDNEQINIYPPLNLDQRIIDLYQNLKEQGYDLFNSKDNFYNDICSPYNSYNDTDVILNDRRNDYYIPNISLCEENCEYQDFNVETLKANCQCNVKTEINSDTNNVKFSPNIIFENFYKVERYANIKVVICYRQVFNKERLKKNWGSYITIIIAFLFIISMSLNFININKRIRKIIHKLILQSNLLKKEFQKKEKETKNNLNEKYINKNKRKREFKDTKKIITSLSNTQKIKLNTNKDSKRLNNLGKKSNKNKNKNCNPPKKKWNNKNNISKVNDKITFNKKMQSDKHISIYKNKKNINYYFNTNINININNSLKSNENLIHFSKNNNKKNLPNNINTKKINLKTSQNSKNINNIDKIIKLIPKNERIKYFIDDELNSLDYKYALKIDFRSYFQFYYSLLKQTQLIIFTFFINDYNLFPLKLSLFLISFELYFFMNTLFFDDDSLHKIYKDEGKYDFLYQIPKILYSTIVSQVLSSILEKLSLSQDKILELKEKDDNNLIKKEKVIKCIKIKCLLFFIIGIILLFGFWYYLSAFCSVYYNTQIPLIKDNFVSFLSSMIYPFLFDLLPAIFRIVGLRTQNKCLYITSKIVTIILGIL